MSLNVHCVFQQDYSKGITAAEPDLTQILKNSIPHENTNTDKCLRFCTLASHLHQYAKDYKGCISITLTDLPFDPEGHIDIFLPVFLFLSSDMPLWRMLAESTVTITPSDKNEPNGVHMTFHVPLQKEISAFEQML